MVLRLRTLLGDHPGTAALKRGLLRSDQVTLDFADITPTHRGFKPMVRDQAFDVAEMAVVTYLMAKSFGKPMVLLPCVMMARFPHGYAVYRAELGDLAPRDLAGRRVGIRSFTTTTGAWLRGILANDYGVELGAIDWVTFEEAHVAEFRDTSRRAPAGRRIVEMLLEGELDAVLGEQVVPAGATPLFADVDAEQQAWFERHRVRPINHMVVVSTELSNTRPDAVKQVFELLQQSAAQAAGDAPSFTSEEITRSLALISQYAAQQQLIPRPFAVDELFDDVTRSLR